jgi:hypothetical protein
VNLIEKMHPFRHEASWAVWATNVEGALTGDALFPKVQAEAAVHGRAMIVSYNPATVREAADPNTLDWANFHSSAKRHNDLFLAAAFHGTPFWGAYMTDLHADIADPNLSAVKAAKKDVVRAAQVVVRPALIETSRSRSARRE